MPRIPNTLVKTKEIIIEGVKIKFIFEDFPGNKNWLTNTEFHMIGTQYYLFLYDVTNKSSFNSIIF